ncbi:coiled-coil domain-containing protein [Latilactobacillus curvatus]|uniref:coiled-coil domain-containing protein n=1 Tax=Latilactobacillus curvatus TaxID=28038 RepID=UPI0020C83192|nr:CHAP domain-containing protein [Latilactobacillus curvatus]MCP8862527.1 CHAP domain-containing protein [Latilactobacillus curvatus]
MSFKKTITTTIALGLLTASVLSTNVVSAATSSEAQEAITANKNATNDLLKQIESANIEVIGLDQKISTNASKIADQEAAITKANNQIESLSGQITDAQKEVSKRTVVLKKQLVTLQEKSGDAVSGNVYVDFLLNSNDLSDLVSRSFTINKLNQASKEALDDVNSAKAKLSGLKTEQENTKASLVATKTDLEKQKANLESLKSEADQKQTALSQKINDNKDELTALQADFDKASTEEADAAAKKAADAANNANNAKKDTPQPTSIDTPSDNKGGTSVFGGSGKVAGNSAGNSYAWGQCTWYVKSVAPWAGNNWGNGAQWGASAAAAGFTVNHIPAAGAIVSFAGGQMVGSWAADGTYGHVAYVQSYDAAAGTITITQGGMGFSNPAGPNTQTISNAGAFTYIHN